MNKTKALICTVLFTITISTALYFTSTVNITGINLHDFILEALGYLCIGHWIGDFYGWLRY